MKTMIPWDTDDLDDFDYDLDVGDLTDEDMVPAICTCRAAPGRIIFEPTCPFHGDNPFMADNPDEED